MKKTLGILSLLALISFAFTFSLNKSSESNIQFSAKNFNEVLADAANAEKLVFIDVSTSWCGYCKKMKANTYTDASVINLVNSKYISKSIDAEKGEGIAIAKKYNVRAYPTVLVLNAKGELLKTGEGYLKPNQLIQFLDK
jgi:thiol:disulfide interchange protein